MVRRAAMVLVNPVRIVSVRRHGHGALGTVFNCARSYEPGAHSHPGSGCDVRSVLFGQLQPGVPTAVQNQPRHQAVPGLPRAAVIRR